MPEKSSIEIMPLRFSPEDSSVSDELRHHLKTEEEIVSEMGVPDFSALMRAPSPSVMRLIPCRDCGGNGIERCDAAEKDAILIGVGWQTGHGPDREKIYARVCVSCEGFGRQSGKSKGD